MTSRTWHAAAAVAALTSLLCTDAAWAATPMPAAAADSTAKRPRVCLVLSGGGARGAAHVGVIKILEQYRVPIDCIAGTSMGALVGGAFASGMSVPEMEKITSDITVQKLFKERPPREELAIRRKSDDFRNYIGPEIGTGADAAVLTRGVVTGVQLETVLRKLSRVQGHVKFDELPIPFRAVATDLVTGKAVVFSEGELANVMRASMSVPGAVAPAEYGGMTLVDGMLTSNLPVEAARAMGADIVIAVNVGTPLLKREQLTSIFGVATQMLSILTEQNVQASIASLKTTDILISPELGDYSTGDFDNLSKITPLGEEAALKVADALSRLSLPPAEYAALRARQQQVPAPDLAPVAEIRFAPLKHVNPEVAQGVMQTQTGEPLEPSQLDADMRRLYGTGDFEHVNYRILEEPGKRVLVVDAVEKAWGPNYLRFGLGLSSDFDGAARFNVIANHRMTWLNELGAELRTDVQLGFNNRLRLELYQPFEVRGRYFIAPRVDIRREELDIFLNSDRIATYQIGTRTAGLDLGVQFGPYAELRTGVEGGRVNPTLEIGSPIIRLHDQRHQQGGIRTVLHVDQLDSASFARAGWGADFELYNSLSELGAADAYNKWRLSGGAAYSLGENTARINLTAGGRIGSRPLPGYDQFQWGGFLRQSGYATGQLLGSSLQFGQIVYYRRIVRGGLLDGAYGGLSLEVGRYGTPLVPGNTSGTLKSLALFVAVDSPLGPVYLGYGHAADGAGSLYFYLGLPL